MRSGNAAGSHTAARTATLTVLALVAFAANSLLTRLALRPRAIDAASFWTIRVLAGAGTLLLVSAWRAGGRPRLPGSWTSATVLFLYGVPFSFAYNGLSAGVGALVLFGSVQLTMILSALVSGERPRRLQWLGLGLALGGLTYLVLPGLEAPPVGSAALMAFAGMAWAVYTLRGRGADDPLGHTTGNFLRCVPLTLALGVATVGRAHVDPRGVVLAVASGSLASGLGYVIWYAALQGLTTTRAAVVQLSVPIIAAAGGVLFLAEPVSVRLVLAAVVILGGIALTMVRPPGVQ